MTPRTHHHGAWRRTGVWPLLAIYATTTLLIPGCASQTAPPIAREQSVQSQIPFHLPAGAKVALTQGSLKRPFALVYGEPGSPPHPKMSYRGKASCNPEKFVGLGQLGLLGLALGLSMWGVTCATSSIAAAEPIEVGEEPKKLVILGDAPKEPTAERRKAPEGKSDPAPDTARRELAASAFATSIAKLRPLHERVRSYAGERSLGELAEPSEPTSELSRDGRNGRQEPDFIIELGIDSVEMRPINLEGGFYWFGLVAQGRLVRVKDRSVVQAFQTESNTNPYPWTPDNVNQLSEELDFALNILAQRIVDEWIEPALKQPR